MKTPSKITKPLALSWPIRRFLSAGLLGMLILTFWVQISYASIGAVRIATGLAIPLYVCAPPGDTGRIFIAEQHGQIKIVDLTTNTVLPTPFLDITSEVGQGQGTGILGMTFDPIYSTNGFFYVS